MKWKHFENIHRLIANSKKPDLIFNSEVCITQKLDGSNLGIHIKKYEDSWSIINIIGRNSIIWYAGCNKSYNEISYGSVGILANLPEKMLEYGIKICNELNVCELVIYGEVLKLQNQKYTSWHPFGYAHVNEPINFTTELKVNYLTSETHKLFNKHSAIKTSDSEHNIFPPKIMYKGKLCDGIQSLSNQMKMIDLYFEGVFIIGESDGWGCY